MTTPEPPTHQREVTNAAKSSRAMFKKLRMTNARLKRRTKPFRRLVWLDTIAPTVVQDYTPVLGPNGQPMYNEVGERTQPCVWYHARDHQTIDKESIVDLSWGGDYEHGRTVRRLFQEEGVSVEWDGSEEDKITLYFGAKKDPESFLQYTLPHARRRRHQGTRRRVRRILTDDESYRWTHQHRMYRAVVHSGALRNTYESLPKKLVEIYDFVMSKLHAGGYRVIFGGEFMHGRISACIKCSSMTFYRLLNDARVKRIPLM